VIIPNVGLPEFASLVCIDMFHLRSCKHDTREEERCNDQSKHGQFRAALRLALFFLPGNIMIRASRGTP
jgi:hypothetical protein